LDFLEGALLLLLQGAFEGGQGVVGAVGGGWGRETLELLEKGRETLELLEGALLLLLQGAFEGGQGVV